MNTTRVATKLIAVAATVGISGGCAQTPSDEPVAANSVSIQSGVGAFAYAQPDGLETWWASFAFPSCRESGVAPDEEIRLVAADIKAVASPRRIKAQLVTYAATEQKTITRGGFVTGLPKQVSKNGRDYVAHDGLTAGTVQPLEGSPLVTDCESLKSNPRGKAEYVALSMLVGDEG